MAYRLGFVMEQTLGHITHTQNFQHWVSKDRDVVATWILVKFGEPDKWGRLLPGIGNNWTLRSSLDARAQLRNVLRAEKLDGLFFHTQVIALFAQRLMGKIPSVVSMDATPLNFDRIGTPYNHAPSTFTKIEAVKNALNRRTFSKARQLVSWHHWGKDSLVRDYGIDAEKVNVIPPGIDVERWAFARETRDPGPVRFLFVGGDLSRKGGDTLLAAFARDLMHDCELDIVTRDPVDVSGLVNVRVHNGLGPNTPALLQLYGRADAFILPTLADTLGIVNIEAMASGLPVVTTNVGAVTEVIEDGVNGFVVPPSSAEALGVAMRRLADDPELRRRMGEAGRRRALERFNGSLNYPRILEICKRCVDLG